MKPSIPGKRWRKYINKSSNNSLCSYRLNMFIVNNELNEPKFFSSYNNIIAQKKKRRLNLKANCLRTGEMKCNTETQVFILET